MNVQVNKDDKGHILTLGGKLDAVTAPAFEQQVNSLLDTAPCSLIIDFAELDYISSAGLRALLATAKRIMIKGGQLCCANVTGTVKEVFDISGFNTILQIRDSVDDAMAAIG